MGRRRHRRIRQRRHRTSDRASSPSHHRSDPGSGVLNPVWLTVDTDEPRHRPAVQGHPTRSKGTWDEQSVRPSQIQALRALERWHLSDPARRPLTLFVIAEQLRSAPFSEALLDLIDTSSENGGTVTVGCHGWSHRSWSAWDADPEGFDEALERATTLLSSTLGSAVRPWFRAPAGYVAPWMAQVLAGRGYRLDSSVNPTFLLRRKAGPNRSWSEVTAAMDDAGIVERPWMTHLGLPANGPALHIPVLRLLARRAWMRVNGGPVATEEHLLDAGCTITTLYWHLDDHLRRGGLWTPPIDHLEPSTG